MQICLSLYGLLSDNAETLNLIFLALPSYYILGQIPTFSSALLHKFPSLPLPCILVLTVQQMEAVCHYHPPPAPAMRPPLFLSYGKQIEDKDDDDGLSRMGISASF